MTSVPEKNGAHNRFQSALKAAARVLSKKWARRFSGGTLVYALALILALWGLITVATVAHRSGGQLQEAAANVAQTREILDQLAGISASLSEVESSARSFAISGKQSHLTPFYTATKAVRSQVAELKVLLRYNPGGLQTLNTVEPVIAKHLKVMNDMVELGNKNLFRGFSQRSLTDEGNTLMEQIQVSLGILEKEHRRRLEQDQSLMAASGERVTMLSVDGIALAGALTLVCGAGVLRATHGRARAEEKLDRLLGSMPDALVIVNAEGKIVGSNSHTETLFGYDTGELQGTNMALLVPERFRQAQRQYYAAYFTQRPGRAPAATIELCGVHKNGREFPVELSTKPLASEKGLVVTSAIRDITERKQVEEQISKLNKELAARALELETANKELEAFSYSVSHDLRSPLQNIDSFSQILIEDYSSRLNAEGRDYVERLRGSCKHMEDIIDALLALSNMMRNELMVSCCDLSALAKAVAADLKNKNPDRRVEWVIADGLSAEGDAQLLRVALENLLGNAWKFTAHRPRARIEFGALPQSDGARTYFVRDDGAGFDMQRADSLFTPFKRLHDQSQFRGTGIGLATVQRVIHRHRGKIWAEGAVNQGATFCFTLGADTRESNGHN